jgi:hypothetical protein
MEPCELKVWVTTGTKWSSAKLNPNQRRGCDCSKAVGTIPQIRKKINTKIKKVVYLLLILETMLKVNSFICYNTMMEAHITCR